MTVHNSARSQLILRATVRAIDSTGACYVKKYARVHAPEGRAWTGAMQGQIGSADLHRSLIFARGRGLRHRESQRKNGCEQCTKGAVYNSGNCFKDAKNCWIC